MTPVFLAVQEGVWNLGGPPACASARVRGPGRGQRDRGMGRQPVHTTLHTVYAAGPCSPANRHRPCVTIRLPSDTQEAGHLGRCGCQAPSRPQELASPGQGFPDADPTHAGVARGATVPFTFKGSAHVRKSRPQRSRAAAALGAGLRNIDAQAHSQGPA